MEDDRPKTPVSVRMTQGILLLTTVFFTWLLGLSIVEGHDSLTSQPVLTMLLIVLPVVALVGLFTGASWGKRAATVALLSLWSYQIRMLIVFATFAYDAPSAYNTGVLPLILVVLSGFIMGIPLLLLKLYRGRPESSFFAEGLPSTDYRLLATDFSTDYRLLTTDFSTAIPDLNERLLRRDSDLLFEKKVG